MANLSDYFTQGTSAVYHTYTITNPDAATGNMTGWTADTGTGFEAYDMQTVADGVFDGINSQYAFGGGNQAACSSFQDITAVAGNITAALIDASSVIIYLDFYATSYLQLDTCRVYPIFLDGSGNEVRNHTHNRPSLYATQRREWVRRDQRFYVPAGTRTIRIYMEGERNNGTYNNSHVGLIEMSAVAVTPSATFTANEAAPYLVGVTEQSANAPGTGNITVNVPPGTADGDMLVWMQFSRNTLVAAAPSGTGWTERLDYDVGASTVTTPSSGDDTLNVWTKTWNTGDGSSFTLGLTDQGTDGYSMVLATFRNVTTFVDENASFGTTAPALTASAGDLCIVCHGTVFDISNDISAPPPTLRRVGSTLSSSAETGISVSSKVISSAGSTGTFVSESVWDTTVASATILVN